ncbi:MAG: tetratricopeptide repeat protein [Nitrospinae bacterium]|nr:tetratricopeptide repeat protein [Nitrospinota bacterium]
MKPQQNSAKKYLIVAVVFIVVITFLLYLPALKNSFVNWDDDINIYENTHIRAINGDFLKWAFSTEFAGLWHPLTMLSFAIDYVIWGLNPRGYHLTNILLHTANTALVFFTVIRLISISSKQNPLVAATVTALLFGIHPLHVESVAWITERKGLLCAFFYLLTLLSYFKYTSSDTKRKRLKLYTLSLSLFILALMSKPMAVSLPIVLLILDFYPLKRLSSGKGLDAKALIEKIPFFLLTIVSSLIAILVQSKAGALPLLEQYTLKLRILNAIHSYIVYLIKMLLPINLAPYYPFPFRLTLFHPVFIISLIVFTTIALLGVLTLKRDKPFLFTLWLYYIITLIPVIGIVKVGGFAMAARYSYLPSVGPFLLTGIGIVAIFTRKSPFLISSPLMGGKFKGEGGKRAFKIAIISVLILLSGVLMNMTYRQIGVWKDSMTLWSHQIRLFPGRVALAYNNRGLAYDDSGNYQEAIEDYSTAIGIDPKFVIAYNNRGAAYIKIGNHQKAVNDFNMAIRINQNPKYAEAYISRGFAYSSLGNHQEAIKDYTTAISMDSKHAKAYNNRGNTYVSLGNYQEALKDYNMAITLDLWYAEAYYNRGDAYINLGKHQEALKDCSMAISLNPKLSLAYYNRGNIYISSGKHQEAIKDYNIVISLDPQYVKAYNNRGIAYINLGKHQEAIESFNMAIKLDPKYAQAYYNLGMLYSELGDVEQARINYNKAESLRLKVP